MADLLSLSEYVGVQSDLQGDGGDEEGDVTQVRLPLGDDGVGESAPLGAPGGIHVVDLDHAHQNCEHVDAHRERRLHFHAEKQTNEFVFKNEKIFYLQLTI